MKNKFFAIILSVVLLLPVAVWAVDSTLDAESVPVINQIDEDIDFVENDYKQPISKRKIAKKFLYAMAGVGVSSFAIFFMLTLYNRIRERYLQVNTLDGDTSLETPEDMSSAVKVFLEKTRW